MNKNKSFKNLIEYQPFLIIISGLPLSGKTTLGKKLAKISNIEMLDVDVVRKRIDPTRQISTNLLPPDEEFAIMEKSYILMCEEARKIIRKRKPVAISGTFSRDVFKQPLKELIGFLQENNIKAIGYLLISPDDELEKRIQKRLLRGGLSNIKSLETYRWSQTIFRPINFITTHTINTGETNYLEVVKEKISGLRIK